MGAKVSILTASDILSDIAPAKSENGREMTKAPATSKRLQTISIARKPAAPDQSKASPIRLN